MASSPAEVLRTAPIFRRLTEEDRQLLIRAGQVKLYPKGRVIFSEGGPADYFYSVLRGKVKLVKETPSGKEIIMAILGPGAPVGAVAVYEGVPFPATCVAFEDAALIRIPAVEYLDLLLQEPSLLRGLLGALTHRLMMFNQRYPELAGGTVEARFARFFLKLSEEIGRPAGDGVFLPLRLSRQELADFTGTTVETCIRIMSRWGKDGLVETREDGFLTRNRAALETIASS